MSQRITPFRLPLPFKLGMVNCYLVETDGSFVLIDTGSSRARSVLLRRLAEAGCQPGSLKLILLTHGDFDHTGNAAYLRQAYGAPIAMHSADRVMTEHADMFSNRQSPNFLIRKLTPILFGFRKKEQFQADIFLEDGTHLPEYGLTGLILSIPGHSAGSIGVLLDSGDFFCGDMLENDKAPALGSIMDEPTLAHESLEHLRTLDIQTVYPGHGMPFSFSDLPVS